VLIFKASGVFNFAQGIMVVFAGLTLVGLHENGVPAYLALLLTIGVMGVLAYSVERVVMRPLVNQPDIILLMATIGLTYFLIGFGEFVFGGEPKQMITRSLACQPARRHSNSASAVWLSCSISILQRL
jgi:branched-chain amino acid transport system permease protein